MNIPNLSSTFPQVFHTLLTRVLSIVFPIQSPYSHRPFFAYFPNNFGSRITTYFGISTACEYDKNVQELIHRAKYYGEVAIASEMGTILARQIHAFGHYYDFVTFVPADPKRKTIRGYHIPEIISQSISLRLQIPCVSLVQKIKHTVSQTELSKKDRQKNVKHVFLSKKLHSKEINRQYRILLIDDTVTTGASLQAVRQAIIDSNPKSIVDAWAFATAPLEPRNE